MDEKELTILDAVVHPPCPWKSKLECASAAGLVTVVVVPIDAIFFITDSIFFWRPISSF